MSKRSAPFETESQEKRQKITAQNKYKSWITTMQQDVEQTQKIQYAKEQNLKQVEACFKILELLDCVSTNVIPQPMKNKLIKLLNDPRNLFGGQTIPNINNNNNNFTANIQVNANIVTAVIPGDDDETDTWNLTNDETITGNLTNDESVVAEPRKRKYKLRNQAEKEKNSQSDEESNEKTLCAGLTKMGTCCQRKIKSSNAKYCNWHKK